MPGWTQPIVIGRHAFGDQYKATDFRIPGAGRLKMSFEPADGTVTRHYRQHQAGKKTSTNPIASIFAWTQGLKYRGQFDNTPEVVKFAETLEKVCIATVESGKMTKDVAILIGNKQDYLNTEDFLAVLDENLKKAMLYSNANN